MIFGFRLVQIRVKNEEKDKKHLNFGGKLGNSGHSANFYGQVTNWQQQNSATKLVFSNCLVEKRFFTMLDRNWSKIKKKVQKKNLIETKFLSSLEFACCREYNLHLDTKIIWISSNQFQNKVVLFMPHFHELWIVSAWFAWWYLCGIKPSILLCMTQ